MDIFYQMRTDRTMAGKAGAIFVLHITVILVNISGQSRRPEALEVRRCVLDPCESYLTADCVKHFGFGRWVLYDTLLSPTISNRNKVKVRIGCTSVVNNNTSRSESVIIAMCLLLSGDIHQCPGPVHG